MAPRLTQPVGWEAWGIAGEDFSAGAPPPQSPEKRNQPVVLSGGTAYLSPSASPSKQGGSPTSVSSPQQGSWGGVPLCLLLRIQAALDRLGP